MSAPPMIKVQSDTTGTDINTLPAVGPAIRAESLPTTLDNAVETDPGTPGTKVLNIQGHAGGTPLPVASTAIGAAADAAVTDPALSGSIVAVLKGILTFVSGVLRVGGSVGKAQRQFGPASSTTYSAGQAMTGVLELTNMARVANGTGLMTSATLVLNQANSAEVDLVLFASEPTVGTYTAGTTFTLAAGDAAKVSKVIKITDWTSVGAGISIGEPTPAAKFFRCDDTTKTTSLWFVAVSRGSIPLSGPTDATLTVRTQQN